MQSNGAWSEAGEILNIEKQLTFQPRKWVMLENSTQPTIVKLQILIKPN